jgi:hypothetical protein
MQNDAFITKFNIHDGCRRRILTTNNAHGRSDPLNLQRNTAQAIKARSKVELIVNKER